MAKYGKLGNVNPVVTPFSKRHPRARSWAYFASTDLARSVVETLRGYGGRWSCEVVNFYTKTQLGSADVRVRSSEAVERYVVAVHLAWAYVEERFARERSPQIGCYGDVLRRHRDDHAAAWLRAAVEQGIRTGDVEGVLNRFLRQTGGSDVGGTTPAVVDEGAFVHITHPKDRCPRCWRGNGRRYPGKSERIRQSRVPKIDGHQLRPTALRQP